jgi:hypothetical protein
LWFVSIIRRPRVVVVRAMPAGFGLVEFIYSSEGH